jgi:hypothetical protein
MWRFRSFSFLFPPFIVGMMAAEAHASGACLPTTPEPSTAVAFISLAAMGLIGMLWHHRRRAR